MPLFRGASASNHTMGTRSRIAVQRDGFFQSIYCHWDGYLNHVGRILAADYTDPAKVDALLALGDLSSLGSGIGEKHDFNARDDESKTTTAYGRDRGEKDTCARTAPDLDSLYRDADDCGAEYVYVFHDGAWLVTWHGEFRAFGIGPYGGSPWLPLQPVESARTAEAAEV